MGRRPPQFDLTVASLVRDALENRIKGPGSNDTEPPSFDFAQLVHDDALAMPEHDGRIRQRTCSPHGCRRLFGRPLRRAQHGPAVSALLALGVRQGGGAQQLTEFAAATGVGGAISFDQTSATEQL